MKVAIVADSGCGITHKEAKELGVWIVSTPVLIDGKIYHEDITLTQEEFYEKLKTNASVSTSQPNPIDAGEIWDEILKTHDNIVYFPLSSGLSETCHTLQNYVESEERFKDKVFVVDNQRVSITQRQAMMDAMKLAAEGKSGKEIADWLMKTKMTASIYIMVDTLKYLKKGGRLTPAVAAIGTLLRIKPVLQIQGFKLDQYAKVRKLSDAKTTMINALKKDLEGRFSKERAEGKMALAIAHTQNYDEALKFKAELEEAFPDLEVVSVDPLCLAVSCHIGPGALACGCMIKY